MKKHKGFTLLEVIVVVAIIAILIFIIWLFLGQARNRAADANIRRMSAHFRDVAEIYIGEHAHYGGFASSNTFVCNSESLCQWEDSFVDAEVYPAGYEQFQAMADQYKKGSWETDDEHRIYFGAFGKSYAAVINLRTAPYWCVDSNGNSGVIDQWPEFDSNRAVQCPETIPEDEL